MRVAIFVLLFVSLSSHAADKPIELKKDELAVLVDRSSPDRDTLFDRLNGKIVKLSGNAYFSEGPKGGGSYVVEIADSGGVKLEWSFDPANQKTQKAIEAATRKKTKLSLTVYGRFENGILVDVTTDPKTGGIPYEPKKKPPAKLKD